MNNTRTHEPACILHVYVKTAETALDERVHAYSAALSCCFIDGIEYALDAWPPFVTVSWPRLQSALSSVQQSDERF